MKLYAIILENDKFLEQEWANYRLH